MHGQQKKQLPVCTSTSPTRCGLMAIMLRLGRVLADVRRAVCVGVSSALYCCTSDCCLVTVRPVRYICAKESDWCGMHMAL
jgi:hypothetical protein